MKLIKMQGSFGFPIAETFGYRYRCYTMCNHSSISTQDRYGRMHFPLLKLANLFISIVYLFTAPSTCLINAQHVLSRMIKKITAQVVGRMPEFLCCSRRGDEETDTERHEQTIHAITLWPYIRCPVQME